MGGTWDTQARDSADAGARLKEAMEAKGFVELKPYARHLAGPDANETRVESLRRQLRDWRNGKVRMSDPIAEWLARDLDQSADAFKTQRPPRKNRGDDLAALRAELATARGEIAQLSGRVKELEDDQGLQRAAGDRE